jgi:hypothetical protein
MISMTFFLLMKKTAELKEKLINGFRETVVDVGLIDMPMEGYQYTCFKSLSIDCTVEE